MRKLTENEISMVAGGIGTPSPASDIGLIIPQYDDDAAPECTPESTKDANEEYERHLRQRIEDMADVAHTTCRLDGNEVESVDLEGFTCMEPPAASN